MAFPQYNSQQQKREYFPFDNKPDSLNVFQFRENDEKLKQTSETEKTKFQLF